MQFEGVDSGSTTKEEEVWKPPFRIDPDREDGVCDAVRRAMLSVIPVIAGQAFDEELETYLRHFLLSWRALHPCDGVEATTEREQLVINARIEALLRPHFQAAEREAVHSHPRLLIRNTTAFKGFLVRAIEERMARHFSLAIDHEGVLAIDGRQIRETAALAIKMVLDNPSTSPLAILDGFFHVNGRDSSES